MTLLFHLWQEFTYPPCGLRPVTWLDMACWLGAAACLFALGLCLLAIGRCKAKRPDGR